MMMLVAMLPVVELRGAIPYGIIAGIDLWPTFAAAVIGNMVPIPFILLLIRRIFDWLRQVLRLRLKIESLEKCVHLKERVVRKYRTLGFLILVAISLPGTGIWTGALVASILDIGLKTAIPIIFDGAVIAGIATMMITFGVGALL
ncbi:COG2426 family protein [Oscillibacter ruminantium]|uniref:COG2426 family protein n=1 Tax=Oscillibacter ruminantium TaxID=1263547 RepID=UPI00332EF5E5